MENGRWNGGFMGNHESSSKHCVFFGFVGDFEKVPMEEDVGHGGQLVGRKF